MSENFPVTIDNREALPPVVAQVGHEALEAELAAGRELQVRDAIDKVASYFPAMGKVSEAYALTIGHEVTVPILNASDRELDDPAKGMIADAVERVTWVTGAANMNRLDPTIVVTPGVVYDNGGHAVRQDVVAFADANSRIVQINAHAFDGGLLTKQRQEDQIKLSGGERPEAEVVLVHELGHLVEAEAVEDQKSETNWAPRIMKDFFGNGQTGKVSLEAPSRKKGSQPIGDLPVQVYRDGAYTEMPAAEAYGAGASVKVPSAESRLSHGEYFADAFVGYAYDGAVDQPLKDIARATIDTRLPAGMVEAGPVEQARFERVEL